MDKKYQSQVTLHSDVDKPKDNKRNKIIHDKSCNESEDKNNESP